MKEFSQAVIEKIGYYVYFLQDPRDMQVFYVGKGKGNRIFSHINCALETSLENEKLDLIREIKDGGHQVEHFILRHELDENQALELEAALIDFLSLDNLKNSISGHNSRERGLKTVDEIIQYYDAKPIDIIEPTIIININKKFRRGMSESELYNTTRGNWVVGSRRERAVYAIAAYRGLVREVYKIDSWSNESNGRWSFNGEIADSFIRGKYLNQSLEKYVKYGAQNPIKYVNC